MLLIRTLLLLRIQTLKSERHRCRVPMIMASTQTQITFPVAIPRSAAREESIWLSVAARLLEAKLLQLLRFKAGDVYSVQVGGFFGAEAPSREGAPKP